MTPNHVTPIPRLRLSPRLGGKKELGTVLPSSPRLCAMDTSIASTRQRFHAHVPKTGILWLENIQKWSGFVSHSSLPFHHKMPLLSQAQKKCLTSGTDKARAIVLKLEILGSKSAISILHGCHDSNGEGARQHLTYLTQLPNFCSTHFCHFCCSNWQEPWSISWL